MQTIIRLVCLVGLMGDGWYIGGSAGRPVGRSVGSVDLWLCFVGGCIGSRLAGAPSVGQWVA